MRLSDEQQAVLAGEQGAPLARQLRLLVRLGEVFGAARLVPVGSVQVSGVSYRSIGDPGLEFLEDLAAAGLRVRVPTWCNPAGMDRAQWREMGVPAEFAARQTRILDALGRLGVTLSATCTPYLAGLLPHYREHLAWGESSAVSFANSVLGARSNREGGPSALAAALVGATPEHGLHLDEHRRPTIRLRVDARLSTTADFGRLGVWAGRHLRDGVPFIEGLPEATTTDDLKQLGAAMAASGAVALYHALGHTPEAERHDPTGLPEAVYDEAAARATGAELARTASDLDIAVVGCPHASLREIAEVAALVEGKRLRKPLWVCTSRAMKQLADHLGHTRAIEAAGGRVVADTCMVVAPMEEMGFRSTGVDSGKAACYLPGFCHQRVTFADLRGLVEALT